MLIDQQKGYTTLAAEITHRSPPRENDTEGMIRDISKWSGLDPNAALNLRDPDVARRMMQATIRRETGKVPSWDDVDAGIRPYLPGQPAMTPPQAGGPPLQPPSARGEPLALASPDRRDDKNGGDQMTRLHITGDPRFRAQVLESSSSMKIEGPLVERPGLLGAQA